MSPIFKVMMMMMGIIMVVAMRLGEAKLRFKGIKYHVIIMDWMSGEMLNTHCWCAICEKDLKDTVPIYGNMTWDFRTQIGFDTDYECDLRISNGHIHFFAFREDPDFLDNGCGGRHCIWNATYDGLFLFNIPTQKFLPKAKWGPKPVN
uniref:S-protein homolog n=1 Tax=Opuntia streptacantha TaxID=393608 RepID=A0A7C8YCU6_OPUST